MKCPLIFSAQLIAIGKVETMGGFCLKEECAWWSTEMNQCDPTGLLPWLKKIEEAKKVEL